MIFRLILDWLLSFADRITDVLPYHEAIQYPEMVQAWLGFVTFTGVASRIMPVEHIIPVVLIILTFESALLLYAAYRAFLGLIPAFR